MSFRDWLPWPRRTEKRELTLDQFRGLGLLDEPTAAGVAVTERTALTLASYWAGVNLIASAIAKLPRKVYRKVGEDREEQPNHGAAWIVQGEPNPFVVPFSFWRTLLGHVLTWGNGYAEIERDRAMRPIALWTITPDKMRAEVRGGKLVYVYNGAVTIPREDVFHVPGLGFDGLTGYSVVQMARQSLGLGLAAERYGAAFFGNGAFPGVLLEHPAKLTKDAEDRLRASWKAMHQGPDRAHRTAVLEEGMKANALSVPAKDAMLIETREVQVLEVARWLNINPAMLGYKTAERPGGNYESSRLDFLDNTLDPWLVLIEQECNRKLIPEAQRGTYYVEHVRAAVLRTDAKTRSAVQKTYVDMGALTPEQVAKQENLPAPPEKQSIAEKVEALGGMIRAGFDPDESLQVLGLPKVKHLGLPPVTVQSVEPPAPPFTPANPDPAAAARGLRPVVVSLAARFGRREAEKARRAAKRGAEAFEQWVGEFYGREADVLAELLQPVVALRYFMAGSTNDGAEASKELARAYVERSRRELLDLRAQDLEAQTELLLQRWELLRPVEMADAVAALRGDEGGQANA